MKKAARKEPMIKLPYLDWGTIRRCPKDNSQQTKTKDDCRQCEYCVSFGSDGICDHVWCRCPVESPLPYSTKGNPNMFRHKLYKEIEEYGVLEVFKDEEL